MAPTLHLVRHAEGFHNVAWQGEGICDPLLTEKGEEQCAELCKNFPYHDKIDLLMASCVSSTEPTSIKPKSNISIRKQSHETNHPNLQIQFQTRRRKRPQNHAHASSPRILFRTHGHRLLRLRNKIHFRRFSRRTPHHRHLPLLEHQLRTLRHRP